MCPITHRRLRFSSSRGVACVRVRDRPLRPLSSSDPGEGTGDEDACTWGALSELLCDCAFPDDSADAPECLSPLCAAMDRRSR